MVVKLRLIRLGQRSFQIVIRGIFNSRSIIISSFRHKGFQVSHDPRISGGIMSHLKFGVPFNHEYLAKHGIFCSVGLTD